MTGGGDREAIARGIFRTYNEDNLRYSQLAPLTVYEEKNTGTNLPAEIEIEAVDGDAYKLLFMAKGGGSANKSLLFQETKALLNPSSLMTWLDEKLRTLGTAACPPYHLALVIGGTSAEFALKTAKLASARYLDSLPETGNELGRGFRDRELEQQVLALTQEFGIGAQFGGKYFCHDVRVIRLPRHGASCPVALAVSCSADRQALGKITAEGVFLEQLETDPAKYLPEVTHDDLEAARRRIDLTRPMAEIRETLSHYPVKTRVMLNGPMVVARDIAHAKIKERLDAGEGMPQYLRDYCVYYAGPAKTPEGYASGSFGPTTAGAWTPTSTCSRQRRLARDARQGQPLEGGDRRVQGARRLLPRLDRRPGGGARPGLHHQGRGARVPRARHGSGVEDRGPRLPRVRRRRRQGQRLLQRSVETPSRASNSRLSATALRPPP